MDCRDSSQKSWFNVQNKASGSDWRPQNKTIFTWKCSAHYRSLRVLVPHSHWQLAELAYLLTQSIQNQSSHSCGLLLVRTVCCTTDCLANSIPPAGLDPGSTGLNQPATVNIWWVSLSSSSLCCITSAFISMKNKGGLKQWLRDYPRGFSGKHFQSHSGFQFHDSDFWFYAESTCWSSSFNLRSSNMYDVLFHKYFQNLLI